MAAETPEFYVRAQRRIGTLTLTLGLFAAAITAVAASPMMGAGVAAGSLLAWMNYRWLEGGVKAVAAAAMAQSGTARTRVPFGAMAKFAGRYVLIGICAYVIVTAFDVPVLSVLAGLLALGAAAMAEGLYEVFFPNR